MKDRDNALELLYLEMDGELTAGERRRLDGWLRANEEAAGERRSLARLSEILQGARVQAREGFASEVIERLPAASWEARHPRTWWVAALFFAVLSVAAATTAGLAAGAAETSSPILGAVRALGGLVAASLVAGAGLMTASWQGVGTVVSGLLEGSPLNWIALAVLVVGLNVLLVRRLHRRQKVRDAIGLGSSRNRK